MKKLAMMSPTWDMSGYATVMRNIILKLTERQDLDLVLEPLRWVNSGNIPLNVNTDKILRDLEVKGVSPEYKADMGAYTAIHGTIATEFVRQRYQQKKVFGFTMLETDRIPPMWVQRINTLDGVFVPSTFNMVSFASSGVKVPIRVVPLGIDHTIFNLDKEPLYDKNYFPSEFNFLLVGQWTQQDRKNISRTLKVFLETFKGRKDVGIILKVNNIGVGTADKILMAEQIGNTRKMVGLKPDEGPYVYLIHGAMSTDDMSRLYHNAQVLVLPSNGEAWGMPLLEAACSGIPVITTGGTGAEMFLNPEHSILLNYKWQQVPRQMLWQHVYEPAQNITTPDWEEFRRMLSRVYEQYSLSKEAALKQYKEIKDRDFSWQKSSDTLMNNIDELGGFV